jgi:site-specific DNA recombinase
MRFRNQVFKTILDVLYVVIYLRKSRDDEDESDVLWKHRERLVRYAEEKGWQYVIYEEIGSSDTIEYRPVFKKLLEEVKNGVFDAVLVVHPDRITRGDSFEYGIIKRTFQQSDTLVITPEQVINYKERSLVPDFMHNMARYEFEEIKRRFMEGKRAAFSKGFWWNGPAPYGYKYNSETKHLEINEQEAEIFRYIVDSYLQGKGIQPICMELRRQGVRTRPSKKKPNGSAFQEQTVKRWLRNIVYLGHTAAGKTQASLHKDKKREDYQEFPQEEWEIMKETHPPLLTQEEFEELQFKLDTNQKIPRAANANKQLFSGLIICGKCGYGMTFSKRKRNNDIVTFSLKTCQKYNEDGVKCGNSGIEEYVIKDVVKTYISKYYYALTTQRNKKDDQLINSLESELKRIKTSIKKHEKQSDKIKELYLMDLIDSSELKQRIEENNNLLKSLNKDKKRVEGELERVSSETFEDKIARFNHFKENFNWDNIDPTTGNKLLRTIIDKIYYTRLDNGDVELKIQYR